MENSNSVQNTTKLGNEVLASVSGGTDIFGTLMTCSPKYSNCQLCKYKTMPQNSDVCTYCAKHNKSTEYYR